jgi:hypothetical protein
VEVILAFAQGSGVRQGMAGFGGRGFDILLASTKARHCFSWMAINPLISMDDWQGFHAPNYKAKWEA